MEKRNSKCELPEERKKVRDAEYAMGGALAAGEGADDEERLGA
jgi:hypothetical protein